MFQIESPEVHPPHFKYLVTSIEVIGQGVTVSKQKWAGLD